MHHPAPTLDRTAQTTAAGIAQRFPLTGRLTLAQIAEHNRFIDAMREVDARQDFVSTPSRFVGGKSGLPDYTTI